MLEKVMADQKARPFRRKRVGGLTYEPSILVEAALGSIKRAYDYKRARSLGLWPEVVGADLARLTRASKLQDGVMIVEAKDSTVAHHLAMQRHHFLQRLNPQLEEPLKDIRFVVGEIERHRPPEPEPEELPPARPEDVQSYMDALQDLPNLSPEWQDMAHKLAQAINRRRHWREQQGWQPCPVCAQPSPAGTQPCPHCARQLADAHVQRAAEHLVRQPHDWNSVVHNLGDAPAKAARYLALQQLTGQLRDLALFVVQHEGLPEGEFYVPLFLEQVQFFLVLRWGVPRQQLGPQHEQALPAESFAVLQNLRQRGRVTR